MKTFRFIILLTILLGLGLASCSTTSETTTKDQKEIQKLRMAQQDIQRQSDRSGLSIDEIQKIDDYAKKKAYLACKMEKIDKSASEALSEVAENDIKESIIAMDIELTALGQEIDAYCNNELRMKNFIRAYNQYYLTCK